MSIARFIPQPDGTEGIATVELKNRDGGVVMELVGCAIHLSTSDKSLRNILKIDEEDKKVKYFIFVPWFNSCRPSPLNEISISTKLHRFTKRDCEKKIDTISQFNFEKYENDDYFVIPCKGGNIRKSSFLHDCSLKLLLHNNSSQLLQNNKTFYGFNKEKDENLNKDLLKFFKFNVTQSTADGTDGGYDVTELDNLEEQGVVTIREEKASYVIGCYKKEDTQINIFCFLLKGLEEIPISSNNSNPEQPQPGANGQNAIIQPEEPQPGANEQNVVILEHPPPSANEQNEQNAIIQSEQHQPGAHEQNAIIQSEQHQPGAHEQNAIIREQPPDLSQGQESEDGRFVLSTISLTVSRPHQPEAERKRKKEWIHRKYGPKVGNMPHDVKHQACIRLNPLKKVKANDYRDVADKIGMDSSEIASISDDNPNGRMTSVFEVMISKGKTTNDFVDILYEIERYDVVDKMYDMACNTD